MRTLKLTKSMLIKAIEGSNGIILTIAQKLKVDRKTIRNYLKKYPELNELLQEEKENILDFAESKLIKKIQEEDPWAIKFILLNQGQSRGYGDKDFKIEENPMSINFNIEPPEKSKE